MITEQYVEFETAKLLKEKGFDVRCRKGYWSDKQLCLQPCSNSADAPVYACPTQSLAMRWLREVHNIYLQFNPYWAEGDMRNPCNWYWTWISLENIHEADRPSYGGKTYEECAENAIKYCLENLI